ncbi:MAG: DUF1674 domain-containing protein [Xanthomonadaceae bacterium]|nr:DUF1674 domain-containing protein [Xanthomonadaceae bacterium]MDE3071901.1 DUF1674 domain-containing protein [Pseudomonadota bacterium]
MSDTSPPVESNPAPVPVESAVAPNRSVPGKTPVERPAPDPTRYGDWEKNGRCIDF